MARMEKLDALSGMLPKREAGHTDGLTDPYNWFQQRNRNALGSAEHGVSSVPPVGNPEANGGEHPDVVWGVGRKRFTGNGRSRERPGKEENGC